MTILVNLVYRIGWQPIAGCIMPDIRILSEGRGTETKYDEGTEIGYNSQISLSKLNNVSLFHEIQVVFAAKYLGVNHLLIRRSFPGNWNTLPGNSD